MKFLKGQIRLVKGLWEDKADISGCLNDAINGVIRFTATVTDVDNDKNVAIREFQPKAPNFQIIPLRPFFDATTKFVRIYFKALLSDVIGNKIEGFYQCISSINGINGANTSFLSNIEESIDIPINSECMIYIFRAYRISGTRESNEIHLILPRLLIVEDLKLSMINPSDKIIYNVGDKFEASIPSLMNYVVICNKKDLVQSGSVSINGILSFSIDQSMQGYCILHVFGSSQKITQSDMWIFFVESSTCPEKFSLKSSADILHPPSNVTITVKAPKGSVAVVRAIDEKLQHMINAIQAPKSNIYWNLNVFNEPSREENAPRLVNFIDTMSVYQHIRETCRTAGSKGPSNPFMTIPPPQEVSDISNYCIREYNKTSIIASHGVMFAITDGNKKLLGSAADTVSVATVFPHNVQARPPSKIEGKQEDVPLNLNDAIKIQNEIADELFLRTFFPEVWYFDDLKFS
uniref:Alpha-2-macroglobulin bait region domain-containing protein n=1 Tax=Panagrolaimus davidi TaxID=227884 RepID=A0A914PZR5_9BILA